MSQSNEADKSVIVGCIFVAAIVSGPITEATGLHGPVRWLAGGAITAVIGLVLLWAYRAIAKIRGKTT